MLCCLIGAMIAGAAMLWARARIAVALAAGVLVFAALAWALRDHHEDHAAADDARYLALLADTICSASSRAYPAEAQTPAEET